MSRNTLFLIVLCLAILSTGKSFGAPAFDGPIRLRQPSGHSFEARQSGDEFHNWMETTEGYAIQFNKHSGCWEYLLPREGSAEGGLAPRIKHRPVVGEMEPLKWGIPKKLQPPRKSIQGLQAWNQSLDAGEKSLGKPARGAKSVLVIGIDFPDRPSTYSASEISGLVFGPSGSVSDYFKRSSYSAVSISPAHESHGTGNDGFIGWLRMPSPHPDTGYDLDSRNQQLTRDAVEMADGYIDYSSYDADGNGILEPGELSILIIVAGFDHAFHPDSPSVYGHRSVMSTVGNPVLDGVILKDYAQFGEIHRDHPATIGIIAHELGHLLFDLPDLYDTNPGNGDSEGVGDFCIMGTGLWGADKGRHPGALPTYPCAWSKEFLAWGEVESVASSKAIAMPKVDANPKSIFRINTPDPDQYFLLENREFSGFDAGFRHHAGNRSHGGVAIYHIDGRVVKNKYGPNLINADSRNKGVDVEEANEGALGHSLLDAGLSKAATRMFFFKGNKTAFDPATLPSTKLNGGKESGISLKNISAFGKRMTLSVLIERE
ncbi:MAG: M6 family metalloprotease domain-containing protein [Nitrospinae bacterium]|nr:M6 family metalloprotease domain-containing protein [Nitrospinota bacterium]